MPDDSAVPHGLREARVRGEMADAYPWAPSGVWLSAASLSDLALRHSREVSTAPERALRDDVFEFRGGHPEYALRRRARTRWSDYPAQVSRTPRR